MNKKNTTQNDLYTKSIIEILKRSSPFFRAECSLKKLPPNTQEEPEEARGPTGEVIAYIMANKPKSFGSR